MGFLRYILRLFVVMLFSVLGASMAFSVSISTSDISFFQAKTTHFVKGDGVGFAARAPPLAVTNVAATGGVTSMQGSAFAVHGQETVAALFGFDAGHIATNNGATGANNVNNAVALNRQLTAQEIAGGHGFEKHVLQQGEFAGLGIRTRDQYAAHIENVLNNPSSVRYTTDGRSYHLQESTGTVVVRNPNAADGGTAFQPQNWNEYLTQIPTRTEPY